MTRRGGRRGAAAAAETSKRKVDYHNLRNPFPMMSVFSEDEIANMKSHLEHCYDLNDDAIATDQTDMHDIKEEPFRRIMRSDDPIFVAEHGGKKVDGATTSKLAFLKLNKIKGYLDDIFLG